MSTHVKYCPGCGKAGTVRHYSSGSEFPCALDDPELIVAADFDGDLEGYDFSIKHYRCTACATNFYVSDINVGL